MNCIYPFLPYLNHKQYTHVNALHKTQRTHINFLIKALITLISNTPNCDPPLSLDPALELSSWICLSRSLFSCWSFFLSSYSSSIWFSKFFSYKNILIRFKTDTESSMVSEIIPATYLRVNSPPTSLNEWNISLC